MNVHIIGAGPTGMAVALNYRQKGHNVHVYDKKEGPGGSWWEPDGARDFHSHRSLFKAGFKNFENFLKKLDLSWDTYFEKESSEDFSKYIDSSDYLTLIKYYFVCTVFNREMALKTSLRDLLDGLITQKTADFLRALTYVIDGVSWDTMKSFEFFETVNFLNLSLMTSMYTQKVSGAVMNRDIESKLVSLGVQFHYGKALDYVEYYKDSYKGLFTNGTELSDGILVLCVDNGPAYWLMRNNWGDIRDKMNVTKYTSFNILLEYDYDVVLPKATIDYTMETKYKIIPRVNKNIISCVICDVEPLKHVPPDVLLKNVIHQMGVPEPVTHKICWGSVWDGNSWYHTQTAASYSEGVPFQGKCSSVYMCGMMSERRTPFASIEAAVEVANRFTGDKCVYPVKLNHFLYLSIFLLMILIVKIIK